MAVGKAASAASALMLASLLCFTPRVSALTSISEFTSGFATFYGGQPDGKDPHSPSFGTSVGSCGFGMLGKGQWPYWSVAALSTSNSYFLGGPVQGCGTCFEVQCVETGPLGDKPGSCNPDATNRAIVVQITDQCPECEANHMDIQALTWAKIAKPSPSGGRVNIQYRRVQCAPPSDLSVSVDNNFGGNGWLRLQVTKAGGNAAVKTVALQGRDGGGWKQMNNIWGASWELMQAPPPPLDIRITDGQDNVVEAHGVIKGRQTGLLPTTVQFKITDPKDIQPSGTWVGAPSNITSHGTAVATGSAGGEPQVQAFSGPPEGSPASDASPASPPPSPPTSTSSSSSSSTSPPSTSPQGSSSPSPSPSPSQSSSPSPSSRG